MALLTVAYDDLTPGEPLRTSAGSAQISSELIEPHERLFRFRGSLPYLGLSDEGQETWGEVRIRRSEKPRGDLTPFRTHGTLKLSQCDTARRLRVTGSR